jgi:ech hydrogenase subunit D
MPTEQIFEPITVPTLLDRVQAKRAEGWRLVQIGATRLPEQFELTYSFDREGCLANLRLHLPVAEPRVPSISSVFWCAILYENEIHDLFNVHVEGIAVDFHGNLYQTAVPFPFATAKAPPAKPAAAPAVAPAPALPAPAAAVTSVPSAAVP